MKRCLNLRYALYLSLYWMSAGFVYSYTRVFLEKMGFSSTEVGIELALSNCAAMLLQPLVASWLDRSKKLSLRGVISLMCALALVFGGLLLLKQPLLTLACLFGGLSCMTLSIQPLINAVGFGYMNEGASLNFSATRGVASVAYACATKLLSLLAEKNAYWMLYLYLALTFLILLVTLDLAQKEPAGSREKQTRSSGMGTLLKTHWRFSLVLLGECFIFFQHNILNAYLYDVVRAVGGTTGDMGTALVIAALCEAPVMLLFIPLSKKVPVHTLLRISALFFAIKPAVILLHPTMGAVYVSQAMQLLSYALYIPAIAYYVNELLPEGDRIKGQALITVAINVASVFGALLGGVLIEQAGALQALFAATVVGALGCLLTALFVRPTPKLETGLLSNES